MRVWIVFRCFFFQAEDGIRDLVRSRGLGDVYKRQPGHRDREGGNHRTAASDHSAICHPCVDGGRGPGPCLLYTSDAADERSSVDLGGRRIIKKKTQPTTVQIAGVDY